MRCSDVPLPCRNEGERALSLVFSSGAVAGSEKAAEGVSGQPLERAFYPLIVLIKLYIKVLHISPLEAGNKQTCTETIQLNYLCLKSYQIFSNFRVSVTFPSPP